MAEHTSYVEESFERDTKQIDDRIVAESTTDAEWPVGAGRNRLVVARACLWANRDLGANRPTGSALRAASSTGWRTNVFSS